MLRSVRSTYGSSGSLPACDSPVTGAHLLSGAASWREVTVRGTVTFICGSRLLMGPGGQVLRAGARAAFKDRYSVAWFTTTRRLHRVSAAFCLVYTEVRA